MPVEDEKAIISATKVLILDEDDVQQKLKEDDRTERMLAAALAAPPSDSDLRVLLAPGTDAAAATAVVDDSAVAAAVAVDAGAAVAIAEGELSPEAEAAVEQFAQLYEDAYLTRAIQHFDDFIAANPGQSEAALSAALRAKGIELPLLRERAQLVMRGIEECENDEGWRMIQEDPEGLTLMYRLGPQTETTHCFKAVCELNAELREILSMAREFDLVPSWNSYITQTNILEVTSLVELLVYASVWMPWPFAERDVLIQGVGVDVLAEDGSLAVSFNSPEGGIPEDKEVPAGYEGRTHVTVLPGSCLRLSPLPPKEPGGKPRVKAIAVTMLDSGMWVPEAIITFVMSVFAPFFYSAVLQVIDTSFSDPEAPLPTRIKERPELYEEMRKRVEHFLEGHPDAP